MAEADADLATTQANAKDPISSLAAQIRHAGTGTLARLRRFDPITHPQGALFETESMLTAAGIRPQDVRQRQRWALVLHCIALSQGRHDPRPEADPGAVLARLRFGESRLRQLVDADDQMLATLIPRLARRLAASGSSVNWWPLADLLLHVGAEGEASRARADAARQRLVRRYLDVHVTEAAADGAHAADADNSLTSA